MSLNNDNTPDRAQDADVDDLELQLALELSLIQGPYDQGSLDSIPSAALNYQSNTQNSLMQDLEAVREFYLCSDAENLPEDEETLQVLGIYMADRGEKHTFKIALQNEDVEVDVLVDVKPNPDKYPEGHSFFFDSTDSNLLPSSVFKNISSVFHAPVAELIPRLVRGVNAHLKKTLYYSGSEDSGASQNQSPIVTTPPLQPPGSGKGKERESITGSEASPLQTSPLSSPTLSGIGKVKGRKKYLQDIDDLLDYVEGGQSNDALRILRIEVEDEDEIEVAFEWRTPSIENPVAIYKFTIVISETSDYPESHGFYFSSTRDSPISAVFSSGFSYVSGVPLRKTVDLVLARIKSYLSIIQPLSSHHPTQETETTHDEPSDLSSSDVDADIDSDDALDQYPNQTTTAASNPDSKAGEPSIQNEPERPEDDWTPNPDWVARHLEHLLPAPAESSSFAAIRIGRDLRLMADEMRTAKSLKELGWYLDLQTDSHGDNLFQWIVELHSFSEDLALAADMKRLNINSVVLEIRFPPQFPNEPPFIRILAPRLKTLTKGGGGHVTSGGSLCLDFLTSQNWVPSYTMPSVLMQVRVALASSSPKPARLAGNWNQPYTVDEALEGYSRTAQNHKWEIPTGFRELSKQIKEQKKKNKAKTVVIP